MSPADAPGGRRGRRRTVQTHISVVTLTDGHAFKRKKALRLWGLLDYSTPELRLHWCREELRLNRRLAPDVYLQVAAVGRGREPVVVMRRFDNNNTLVQRLAAGRAGAPELRDLGERLRRFHADHPLNQPSGHRGVRAFARVVHNNLKATGSFVPALFPDAVHRRLEQQLAAGLRRLRPRLRQRFGGGWAVDGHGDLRLEHVLIEAGNHGQGPQKLSVVDCVEFNADLRQVDALSDLAFLVMDLQAHGHSALVPALLEGYGADVDQAVLALFCAYRAHVRAKVAAVSSSEAELPETRRQQEADMARRHLSLALAYALPGDGPPSLILLRGFSGSGKSHLAAALAPWLRADWHRADVMRKQLHGLDPLARVEGEERKSLYNGAANARTEAALLAAARASLEQGRWVLLDATHLRQESRQRATALAEELRVPWLILNLSTPWSVIDQRLVGRGSTASADPSDADLAIALEQRQWCEPLTEQEQRRSLEVPTDRTAGEVLMELWQRLGSGG